MTENFRSMILNKNLVGIDFKILIRREDDK